MKKIAITTYCTWSSYGSVMQSIGLKRALKKLDFESFILYDSPAPALKYNKKLSIPKSIRSLILTFYDFISFKHTRNRYEKSNTFIKKHLDILYYNDYDTVVKHPPNADYYIAGSDQIWHPALCKPLFFLDFLNEPQKRLSYAASMGITSIPAGKEKIFSDFISKIDCISVRENDAVDVIKRYTDKPVSVNIDPTFLLNRDEWSSYADEYYIKKPYILVYAIYWDKNLNKKLKKLHKETGYDIVNLATGFSTVSCNKTILDADPAQFLWLIENAEAVVTSSFHGLAFSIIFNKRFSAVVNPKSPSRLSNILKHLDIQNCDVENIMNFDLLKYNDINLKIQHEKFKAEEYLKGILNLDE